MSNESPEKWTADFVAARAIGTNAVDTITLADLERACEKHGYTVTVSNWDCGEAVEVRSKEGQKLVRVSRDCEETESASTAVAYWLYTHRFITSEDF